MVTIRATVANPKQILLPGMFMRAQLPKGIKKGALLIPQSCVTRANRSDKFVYVINQNNKIEQKFIKIGAEIPDYFVVEEGLTSEDRIVVSNLQKIKVDQEVNPIDDALAAQGQQGKPKAEQPKQAEQKEQAAPQEKQAAPEATTKDQK